jgi:hypothetical protein
LEYLRQLRGSDRENAYHGLVELGAEVIPIVAMSFKVESDPFIRSTLVNVAWKTNSRGAIPFLIEALNDGQPAVWKEALDGLVSFGGRSALEAVRQAREQAKDEKSEWLDEAIREISDGLSDA